MGELGRDEAPLFWKDTLYHTNQKKKKKPPYLQCDEFLMNVCFASLHLMLMLGFFMYKNGWKGVFLSRMLNYSA